MPFKDAKRDFKYEIIDSRKRKGEARSITLNIDQFTTKTVLGNNKVEHIGCGT